MTGSVQTTGRKLALGAAAFAAGALLTQVVLPGSGSGGRGTPMAVLFQGFVLGTVGALTTTGLILVYRTNRVVNFAHAAIGAAGATLCFEFIRYTGVPFPVAFLAGVVLAAATGALFDLVLGRRFFSAPRLVLTVMTIAAAGAVSGLSPEVRRLPFFPNVENRPIFEELDVQAFRDKLPFRSFDFRVGSLGLPFGFTEVFSIVVALLALVAVAAFLRYTRAGVAVRAVAENSERASLLGIAVGSLSTLVWAIAGVLSGIGVTLSGLITSPSSATGFAPELLLPALAAAVIARMRSIAVGAVASVAISVLASAIRFSSSQGEAFVNGGLLVVVAGGLLLQRRRLGRSEVAGESWRASEEQRPVPAELAALPSLRVARMGLLTAIAVAVALFPFLTSTGTVNLASVIALHAIVAVSLVVLTGWTGQVSLGQFALVAVGALVGGSLGGKVGVPFWFAVPAASLVTAAFALLLGFPALRVKGLFLAVTTFAFAVAVPSVLFSDAFRWLQPSGVERPRLLLLDFDDDRSMFFLCVACLGLVLVLVANLRRSRWGRLFIAVRDNEAAVEAVGVPIARLKLMAFAVSGALAGFAGAVLAFQQRGASIGSFEPVASIDIFLMAVIGGVSSTTGALLGTLYFSVVRNVVSSPLLSTLAQPVGALVLLYAVPGGLISIVTALRDEALRIIATRRNIVVPSLFADYDATALERRLVPLAEPLQTAGIAVLAQPPSYTLPSHVLPCPEPPLRAVSAAGGAAPTTKPRRPAP